MLIEILFVLLLGIIAGSITGLTPGLHINLVALLLLVSSGFFLNYFSPLALAIFIISMSITHTFVDFVPSIFLGAPDDDTCLSTLPGHKLLLKGKGFGAVRLTLIGSFLALFVILLMTPLFLIILPKIYPVLKQVMFFILVFISMFLIFKEKENRFWAFFLFMLSGVFGIATLNLAVIKQPLLPMLSGLFGVSLLFMSIFQKVNLPKQKIDDIEISNKECFKAMTTSAFSASLCSFLPGLGSAQAAVLGSEFYKKIKQETFLVLLGAINTIVMGLSFVALYSIGKTRTGSAAIISKLIENFSFNYLVLFLGVIFISGCISYILTSVYARFFALNISKINYSWLCLSMIILVFCASIFFSGVYSILVLITGTSIGIFSSIKGVKKMFLMGCLLLPTILYYF